MGKLPHWQEVRRAKRLLRILDAIDAGARDTDSVVAATGLKRETVSDDLTALCHRVVLQQWRIGLGFPATRRVIKLTSHAPAYRAALQALVDEHDDGSEWTPQPWVHPYRRGAA